jgi:hypothetical protein
LWFFNRLIRFFLVFLVYRFFCSHLSWTVTRAFLQMGFYNHGKGSSTFNIY